MKAVAGVLSVRAIRATAIVVAVGLLLVGWWDAQARAEDDADATVHVCVAPSGGMKLVESCGQQEAALVLVTEAGLQDAHDRIDELEGRVAALEGLLAGVSRSPVDGRDTLLFAGMNVQVVSGTGSTDGDPNGVGNVVIGYNAPRLNTTEVDRAGSHYLVIGDRHHWTRFGGIVAGLNNTASGDMASVTGGFLNTASGRRATVTGGQQHTASGDQASVTGGISNTASGVRASATGGAFNTASGDNAAVTGGNSNLASGLHAFVSSGHGNTASEINTSVIGGIENTASASQASAFGGSGNVASGFLSSVTGGRDNTAIGSHASVSGGRDNTASGVRSSILGGADNTLDNTNACHPSCS